MYSEKHVSHHLVVELCSSGYLYLVKVSGDGVVCSSMFSITCQLPPDVLLWNKCRKKMKG